MRGADIVIVKPVSMAALLPLIRAYCFLGDFFGPRLLGASLNYAYFWGRAGLFFIGWVLIFF